MAEVPDGEVDRLIDSMLVFRKAKRDGSHLLPISREMVHTVASRLNQDERDDLVRGNLAAARNLNSNRKEGT